MTIVQQKVSGIFAIACALIAVQAGQARAAQSASKRTPKLDITVAVNGKDTNPGTEKAPLATLAAARNAARKLTAAGLTKDIWVHVHGGTYRMTEPLVFGPQDSGTEQHSVTYAAAPGETVVLSGGRTITGWKKGTGEIWTAQIPQAKAGNWYFRQLFVNGSRATRARTPNADDAQPWWTIASSTATQANPPGENDPITVKVSGPIQAYHNPGDVELVYMQNNECGWKRLAQVDAAAQTFTLATPNRWNPKVFPYDWPLSIPFAGKPCYLENALEMLDRPGEWYLDRQTGVLSYWPRPGEDMTKVEVVAPVLQKTMLAVAGTPERPIRNLHFQGLNVRHVDWPQPAWGYMAMFCCNVSTTDGPKPGHRPIDAAVEFSQARGCSFTDGGITEVGGMGLCLREGTSDILVQGNDIGVISGGGIALGWPNVAAGYLDAAPPPLPGEYTGYRILDNYVHNCGLDYFGAVGILSMSARQTVIAHNLIHDTAYFGIGVAGSQDPKTPFSGDNVIEYNEIHDAMTTTVDGAAIYVTFAQCGQGTRVRGNVIHDTHGNPYHGHWGEHPPSGGIYLDINSHGGIYEDNILYRNFAAGPLILNFAGAQTTNTWTDNDIFRDGLPPGDYLDAARSYAGLEPAYRAKLLKTEVVPCSRYETAGASGSWSAIQYDFPSKGRGVVQITVRDGNQDSAAQFMIRGLNSAAAYTLHTYTSAVAPQNLWGAGQMPMLDNAVSADPLSLGISAQMTGQELVTKGLTLKIGPQHRVIWIVYAVPQKRGT